jgi:hypothetical protein
MPPFCRYREVVTGRRGAYAGALGGVLLTAALTSACGTESAGYVGQPTVSAVEGPRGVTAPAVPDPDRPQPVFTGSASSTAVPTPLEITRQSGASGVLAPRPTPTPSSRPAAAPPAAPPPAGLSSLRVVQAPIGYSATRQQEMAAYSLRHYGTASWQLTPTMVVLHFTAGGTWAGARATFAADTVNMGELPGTCSHYVIDKDGTVYQLVPTSVRCRHTIGLNDQAIGIEMVQEGGSSATWADQQILNRPAQVGAALALVRSLQSQFGIPAANVIGHAMADAAPQFHDRLGWHNDHADWQAADVAVFRSRL